MNCYLFSSNSEIAELTSVFLSTNMEIPDLRQQSQSHKAKSASAPFPTGSNKKNYLLFSAHHSVSDIQQKGPGRLSGWEEYSWS